MFEALFLQFCAQNHLQPHTSTTPAVVFDDCSLERVQEGRSEVQLIQYRVTCLYSIVLSVNQCVYSAKFAGEMGGNQFAISYSSIEALLSVILLSIVNSS